jgi:threonine synthase
MFSVKGLSCVQCGSEYPPATLFEGCPTCRQAGSPSNVTVTYTLGETLSPDEAISPDDRSMWRYRAFLGVADGEVSLGEGLTPLLACSNLGKHLGLKRLYLKDEGQNPTGSYKDRLASASVTRALKEAAPGIATSSTGNHGSATAAYAARAGLPSLIFTIANVPETMKLQMQSLGAMLIATQDAHERWPLLRYCVERMGWYSTGNYSDPPIGSSPYGIDGYKTIAYELAEALKWQPPDVVVLPVAYGDGIQGVLRGFQDLVAVGWTDRIPRMIAVESGGSLTKALAEGQKRPLHVSLEPSVAFSIHTPISTVQALKAILVSGGTALRVSDEEILGAQQQLGALEGIFVEPASAAVIAALRRLVSTGEISTDEVVVGILTSTGLKSPDAVRRYVCPVPVISPDIAELRRCLKIEYGYELGT